jgi:hypothetical protein
MAYQQAMRGSCDGRTTGMFGEATMAELWDSVGTTSRTGTHNVQERASGGCDAHTSGEISVGTLQAR